VEKAQLFIGQHIGVSRNGEMLSLPGVDPINAINPDAAVSLVRANGPGWHLMSNVEWAALSQWCWKNGFQPRGNTAFGRSSDLITELGVRSDGLAVTGANQGSQSRTLTGSGPVAAGDTVRWIIGDTESGNGDTRRVHILVKPTRPAIETNLVVNTDRRTYLIELRAHERPYMPSVAWFYPENRGQSLRALPPVPVIPEIAQRRYRYSIEGDKPPWRPVNAYDDGRKVYVEFSPGIVQGEMPPLFVVGADGKPEFVNSRAYGNVLIVDRLFAAAELRLGGESQQIVRIVRTDGRR